MPPGSHGRQRSVMLPNRELPLRYVILEHDHPRRHWDFMLEAAAVLRTWKLAGAPRMHEPVAAEKSFDHRLLYLDYEGPISGGRGTVVRWDAGRFAWVDENPRQLVIRLEGERLIGLATFSADQTGAWSFVLRPAAPISDHGAPG